MFNNHTMQQQDFEQLRASGCVCIKTRHIELHCPCGGEVDAEGNRHPSTYPCLFHVVFLNILSPIFGWVKVCHSGIPNEDRSLSYPCCGEVTSDDTFRLQCIGAFHVLFLIPLVVPILLVNGIFVSLFFDLPILFVWCITGGCCGRMCPIKGTYANELNLFHKNDEPVVAVLRGRMAYEHGGKVVYGDVVTEQFYGRERSCQCNGCILCPCYQDLRGSAGEDDSTTCRLPMSVLPYDPNYPEKYELAAVGQQ